MVEPTLPLIDPEVSTQLALLELEMIRLSAQINSDLAGLLLDGYPLPL